MSAIGEEKVLVVPTEWFRQVGYFQGFAQKPVLYLEQLLDPNKLQFLPRRHAEHDPSFKQIIPYVIFCWPRDDGNLWLFQYLRGTGQGENRLHRKRSVGIGGHISIADAQASNDNLYNEALRRELEEEVIVDGPFELECVGFINDDQTDVGTVHLGIVYRANVSGPIVRPREEEIKEAEFWPLQKIQQHLEQFESWSQICINALFPAL